VADSQIFSPASGYVGGAVTMNGAGFGATQGTSFVTFNGSSVTPTSWTDSLIRFNVPPTSPLSEYYDVTVTVGGLTSNIHQFFVGTPATPSISSVSPNPADIAQTVTVTGTNFGASQGSSVIAVAGVPMTPTSWSSTSIQFVVPPNTFSGQVRVTVNGVISNGIFLGILGPGITNVSPNPAQVGNAVTVTGVNFGATQGTSTLTLDDVPLTTSSWSASSILFTVPTWATKGNLKVTRLGDVSNLVNLAVTPTITNLVPNTGQVGTSVTVNGTGFGETQGTSTLKFGSDVIAPGSWSASAITFLVPTKPTAAVSVVVKGDSSNGVVFTLAPPVISSITPTSGGVDTYVTINGTGFGPTQAGSVVTFNETEALPVSWSATKIVVRFPSNGSTGSVVVTVAGLASNGVTFTLSTTGTVSGIVRRASDQAPLSGVLVKALQGATVVATATTVTDGSYSLTGLAPGLYDIKVFAAGYLSAVFPGTVVSDAAPSSVDFYLHKPSISSVSPLGGPVGTPVVINGVRFGTTQGASTVTFNGVVATPTLWSDTKIVTTIPATASTGPLVVTVEVAPSNAVTFGVGTGTLSGTVTQSGSGNPVSGGSIEILRNNAVIATGATIADGTYSIASLAPDTYDVRFSKSGFGTIVSTGKVVTANGNVTADAALPTAGGVGGKVTKADGVTPISGAAVTISIGATAVASVFTNGSGDYVADALGPDTYSVQAAAAGHIAQNQAGVMVTSGNTTTKNFSLLGQSAISYAYDALGRLIGVTDSLGDTATYQYDAVGNLLSIGRYSSAQISIIGFAPTHGTAGSQVTIYGTAFSPTPSSNTVTFNGTSATVTSASTTQLVVTVPAGASTGAIGVTAPSGSTTSSSVYSIP
jgi:YD repeat-containing protein